jgi:preprotein translocase subunit SecG
MTFIIGFIKVIHVLACLVLIVIVLLQAGKGASIGASMGGAGNQTLFGTSGASTLLSKVTTGIAILFMITSLFLAYHSGKSVRVKTSHSVMANTKPAAEATAPAAPKDNGTAVPAAPTATETPAAPEKKAEETKKPDSQQ